MDFAKRNIGKTNRNDASDRKRQGSGGGVTVIRQGGGTSLAEAKKEFLSKKADDNAEGIINFRKGLKLLGSLINNLLKENSEGQLTDEAIMTAKRIMKELDKLNNKFLRKDQPDQTNFLLKFGEFIDSMIAGKGTGIFPDGRIQTDRIEVRGSMTVMDLIINELHAMAGDYSFSDFGKIERVEKIPTTDGNRTYKIYMERELPTDVTNFEENDVLYSIVNNLRVGGTDYYTSWFRPVQKNTSENSLTVVLYTDAEVPGGKNYPPKDGYNVTRKGNALIPDTEKGEPINGRAQSWLISSREGRMMFLQNVYKPILEDYNYALSLGKLPDVKVVNELGLQDDIGLYAQTVVCEKLYQIDWNGDVIPKKVDRGMWSLEVAKSDKPYRFVQRVKEYPDGKHYTELEQHTVYHYGSKWGCIIDETKDEPKWNSTGWVMLEGDDTYSLSFESSDGWHFVVNNINTVITAIVYHGNRDITNALMSSTGVDVEWIRDTGNPAADNTWKPRFEGGRKNVIRLGRNDMGIGWGRDYRKVSFLCRIHIPVGGKTEIAENNINFKV